ncbi:MAG: DUF4301 family protein [Brumimicrobium sp.]|nr:DUF4301 family protein [Brumimicrobium sp.]
MTSDTEIEKQRALVFSEQPEIRLVSPCKLNEGIIRHSSFEQKKYVMKFLRSDEEVKFFIPASGSGSRMFQFLYDFLENPNEENRSKTEKFLNAIEEFPFFELLPYDLKQKVRDYDVNLDEFVAYLLKEDGLNLGALPKGLLPFHRSRSFVLNAFQEQLLQGIRIKEQPVKFHFTINGNFEDRILSSLDSIRQLTARHCDISCSTQDPSTDAIAFDHEQNVILKADGSILKRPSGHGALLKNLNAEQGDVIFIKNIDNIQHESNAENSIENLRYLGGLLQEFRESLKTLSSADDKRNKLKVLNEEFQFMDRNTDFEKMTENDIHTLINKPVRVCGMVKNEGQPGGGPFWVEEKGERSKQIVEKSQIKMKGEQYRLMVQSQYFNPVLMAISTKDLQGNKLDLNKYADQSKYFIVNKKHEGQPIKFMERPGLWNGSMHYWLSIFVEVPSETFTPVKTVLDLLDKPHKED